MKYSVAWALSLAMAPLSMALSVGEPVANWPARRDHHGDKGNDDGSSSDAIVINVNGKSSDEKSDKYGGSKNSVIIIWVNGGNGAETTTVNEKVTVTQTVTAGATDAAATTPAAAASHTVTVGGPAGLVYSPDQLNDVPIGDTVVFEFLSQNHTVTQSGFDTPCEALAGGMDSGFMPNPNNTVSPAPQIAMQVMVDTPLWFYCRQANHCGEGMVFSVNPTEDKTQAQFQALAIAQNGTGTQSPITDPTATPSETQADAATTTAATTASAPAQGTDVSSGEGTLGSDGSCTCVAICSSGSFPVAAQGVGSFGGVAGGLPINMAAIQ